jgi:phosphatidylserine decarboxylase
MVISQAMNTGGGFTAFLATELNKQFKKMFDDWAVFLASPDSRHVLNSEQGGWFSQLAITDMTKDFDGLSFDEIFVCEPAAKYKGFTSWDNFFNRTFRGTGEPNEVRPTQFKDRNDIINGACESTLYRKVATNVSARDTFWLKGEPYSLMHMLNNDSDYAEQFVGGTVLQGFLAVTGYHRWHSPVTGTIKKIVQVEGTYFAQSPATLGANHMLDTCDSELPPYLRSLSFITSITTRALIFIEADNDAIGLMCFIAIGMTEVSTCQATVYEGQRVTKGDELGMFHFGGSSHVLIFRPLPIGVTLKIFDSNDEPGDLIKVRSAIAGIEVV